MLLNIDDQLASDFISTQHKELLMQLLRKHPTTLDHCYRVADIAFKTAEHMTLDPNTMIKVYIAALFHDIGKLYIPNAILNAPRKLSSEETLQVSLHTVNGANLLWGMDMFVRHGVALHHTKYCAIQDHNIVANIIHVCDVYDALQSMRSYKEPFNPTQCITILEEGRGVEYCPMALDALRMYALHQ